MPDKPDGSARRTKRDILFQSGPRETTNIELLIIEAEIAAEEGEEVANPAYPKNDKTERRARTRLDEKDLSPAWEDADTGPGGGDDG